jgi:hypothetical protein
MKKKDNGQTAVTIFAFLVFIGIIYFFANGGKLFSASPSMQESSLGKTIWGNTVFGKDYDFTFSGTDTVFGTCNYPDNQGNCGGGLGMINSKATLKINNYDFGTVELYRASRNVGVDGRSCVGYISQGNSDCTDVLSGQVGGVKNWQPVQPSGNDKIKVGFSYEYLCKPNEGQLGCSQGWFYKLTSITPTDSRLSLTKELCPPALGNSTLVVQTFDAGTLSINSFKYPVKRFCFSQPIVATKPSGTVTSETSAYADLVYGKEVTIPAGETWTFFYQIDATGTNLPFFCDVGAIDETTKKCVYKPAIAYVCDVGAYDAVSGTCSYVPQTKAVCPTGTAYNEIDRVCEYTPDTQAVCGNGTMFDSVANKCIFRPQQETVCTGKYIFNRQTYNCEYSPSAEILCPATYSYNTASDKCEKNAETVSAPKVMQEATATITTSETPSSITSTATAQEESSKFILLLGVIALLGFVVIYLMFVRKSNNS